MKIEKKKRLLSEIDELEKGEKMEEFAKKAKKIMERPPVDNMFYNPYNILLDAIVRR